MSLSFPLLISAVPLYAVDFAVPDTPRLREAVREWRTAHPEATPERARRGPGRAGLRRQLVLRRRTDGQPAGALLRQPAADPADLRDRPGALHRRPPAQRRRAGEQLLPDGQPGRPASAHGALGGDEARRPGSWPSACPWSNTARVWVDEAPLTMPGYRDRVVTVYQDGDEGGLNLAMPPEDWSTAAEPTRPLRRRARWSIGSVRAGGRLARTTGGSASAPPPPR